MLLAYRYKTCKPSQRSLFYLAQAPVLIISCISVGGGLFMARAQTPSLPSSSSVTTQSGNFDCSLGVEVKNFYKLISNQHRGIFHVSIKDLLLKQLHIGSMLEEANRALKCSGFSPISLYIPSKNSKEQLGTHFYSEYMIQSGLINSVTASVHIIVDTEKIDSAKIIDLYGFIDSKNF